MPLVKIIQYNKPAIYIARPIKIHEIPAVITSVAFKYHHQIKIVIYRHELRVNSHKPDKDFGVKY